MSNSKIPNPRRILVLAPGTESRITIPPFLHGLTGAHVADSHLAPRIPADVTSSSAEEISASQDVPENGNANTTSFAGYTTHSPLRLDTKYYSADIPIWVDELPLPLPLSSSSSSTSPPPSATAAASPPPTVQLLTPAAWKSEFLTPEAREVRDAIGAMVLCVQAPQSVAHSVPSADEAGNRSRKHVVAQVDRLKEFVRAAAEVKEKMDEERGGIGDVVGLLVLVSGGGETSRRGNGSFEDDQPDGGMKADDFGPIWWEAELSEMGIYDFEVVTWSPADARGNVDAQDKRNEFGELEGMARIREVLEASEWTSSGDHSGLHDDDNNIGLLADTDNDNDLDIGADELEREMLGLHMAIENGEADNDDLSHLEDDQLEGLLLRVQAIRDMGSDLPDSERRKFAAKAIRDLMKDL